MAIKRRLVIGFLGIQQKRYMAAQQDEAPAWTDCLGQNDSAELDNALFFDYEYSIDQLMEIAGLCVAQVMHVPFHLYRLMKCYFPVCSKMLPLFKGSWTVSCAFGVWAWK